MKLKFKKLRDVKTPTYGTTGAACFDFYAPNDVVVTQMLSNKIPLGLAFEIPPGYAMFIVPRSSTGLKTTLRQSNSIGVIDSDYRGEVLALFDRLGLKNEVINAGDRIAQGFILPVAQVDFIEVDELSDTERGAGGFGSTGV